MRRQRRHVRIGLDLEYDRATRGECLVPLSELLHAKSFVFYTNALLAFRTDATPAFLDVPNLEDSLASSAFFAGLTAQPMPNWVLKDSKVPTS
jgi:hypothetical protein